MYKYLHNLHHVQSQTSPLLYAAKTGIASMVQCLIKHGANVNAANEVS